MTGKQLREAWGEAVKAQTEFLRVAAYQRRTEGFSMAEYRQKERDFQNRVRKAQDAYRDWERVLSLAFENMTAEEILANKHS